MNQQEIVQYLIEYFLNNCMITEEGIPDNLIWIIEQKREELELLLREVFKEQLEGFKNELINNPPTN